MGKRQSSRPEPKPDAQAWVMVSARLPTATANALKLAAAKRQVESKTPNSQQDIIGAAVAEWLKRNGYL